MTVNEWSVLGSNKQQFHREHIDYIHLFRTVMMVNHDSPCGKESPVSITAHIITEAIISTVAILFADVVISLVLFTTMFRSIVTITTMCVWLRRETITVIVTVLTTIKITSPWQQWRSLVVVAIRNDNHNHLNFRSTTVIVLPWVSTVLRLL